MVSVGVHGSAQSISSVHMSDGRTDRRRTDARGRAVGRRAAAVASRHGRLSLPAARRRRRAAAVRTVAWSVDCRGVVGRGRGATASPHFFDRGTRLPLPPTFLD